METKLIKGMIIILAIAVMLSNIAILKLKKQVKSLNYCNYTPNGNRSETYER